jgi:hypothetical protein
MKKSSIIDEKLQIAYQQAHYYVFDPPILLKVGTEKDLMDQLLVANNHDRLGAQTELLWCV